MHARTLVPLFLTISVLGAAARPAGDEPAFGLSKHALLAKVWTEATELELDSYEAEGLPFEVDTPDVTLRIERRVALTDEYEEVEARRAVKLLRTFDELKSDTTLSLLVAQTEEHAMASGSSLEEAQVRFTWDPDEEEYRRVFEEGGDDEQLKGLAVDTDFLGFLPAEAVDPNDTWEIEPEALARALQPSGDLWFLPKALDDAQYVEIEPSMTIAATLSTPAEALAPFEGTIKATYRGRDEVDGVRVGRIEFQADAKVVADLSERVKLAADTLGSDFNFTYKDFSLAWSLKGPGVLLWDLEGGHVHSFRFEGDVELDATLTWDQRVFDEELQIKGSYKLSGTTLVEMTLEE